ncbi:MAG: hypothetical protein CFE26_19180 [Verrucomicrobiales bacterium VVV1]|nr:MAG: hypothetical protein CFE26_19180 [Verrucomicrobiales bacterium VVV1]
MRRKLDHLPRGVRWAVRLLRIAGTVIIMPIVVIFPFILASAAMLISSGSPWVFDFIAFAAAIPIAIGGAIRVMATCIELGHDPSAFDSDYETEWKKFASACLHLLSLIFFIGAALSMVQLLMAWHENRPEFVQNSMNFALHLVLAISFHRGAYFLDRWFERRRHAARLH